MILKRFDGADSVSKVSGSTKTIALLSIFLAFAGHCVCLGDWTRVLGYGPLAPGIPFVLTDVSYTNYSFSAVGWYRYIEGRDAVILHGQAQPKGMFRPVVNYEVATEARLKWKRIRTDVEQSASERVTVSPDNPSVKLSVDMEPFRGAIGTYRYGRLVLENGDSAIFEIEDLLPVANGRDDRDDFRADVFQTDDEKKAKGFKDAWLAEPADLMRCTSLGGRLIGDFIFEAAQDRPVKLEGIRTSDGDFWPRATFEAANSDGQWKKIGESQNDGEAATLLIPSGKAEPVRVLLTHYKRLIGDYHFGRVVFSNGQSGVFSIDLLNPQK